ncbi:hypothetical protein AB6A40_003786 [Gnathostoma spinigerum]|uniref:DUF7087 domain-containing protein n=1 Tax=Gnathostoma spinigerum TaxID=75299 RepID=A0ABD6EKH8_9BILA
MSHQGIGVLLAIIIDFLNLAHTGSRLYYDIDGSFDLRQFMNISNNNLRAQYLLAYLGSLILAVIGHFFAFYMDNIIFSLADTAAIIAALALVVFDTYEVFKKKLH